MIKCGEIGFEAVGTVRVTKTKREEEEEKNGTKAQKRRKEKNRGLDPLLSELRTKFEA